MQVSVKNELGYRNVGVFIRVYITQHFSNLVLSSHLPAYEDGTECSETSAYKIQTPGNYPEENTQHSEHGEILKSKTPVSFISY
jgi:hypothetical protein